MRTSTPTLVDDGSADGLLARAEEQGVTARVDHAEHGADIVDTFSALVDGRTAPGWS